MAATKLTAFLKKSRINAGLSQSEVARLLGYKTPQFISNWERGVSQPPINALKTLAKMYHISEQSLFAIFEEVTIEQVRINIRKVFSKSGKSKKA